MTSRRLMEDDKDLEVGGLGGGCRTRLRYPCTLVPCLPDTVSIMVCDVTLYDKIIIYCTDCITSKPYSSIVTAFSTAKLTV